MPDLPLGQVAGSGRARLHLMMHTSTPFRCVAVHRCVSFGFNTNSFLIRRIAACPALILIPC
jgi:hypothetical protein